MNGQVIMEVIDGVAEITIDRPAKMNAVTPEMATAIDLHCRNADAQEQIRAILIKGAGEKAFCAGSDLSALAQYTTAWQFRNRLEYAASVRAVRKPVVAALHGWVLGGGAEIALAADIRVAAHSTRCGFPEVTRGWVGGGGASQMLPRLIGYGPAMKMLLLGEQMDAAEAFRVGLVDYLVPDSAMIATARQIAIKLAGYSPVATQAVKASVRASLNCSLDAGLRYENEMNTLCFSAGDHLEGIKAFQERREPGFRR